MSQEQVATKEFVGKAVPFQDLLKEAERNPIATFDEWPIKEVRDVCVRKLEFISLDTAKAEWLEKRILMLAKEREDYWEKLLFWYIFSEKWLEIRALEFAISLLKEKEVNEASVFKGVSKIVAGKISRDPSLYWYIPSIRDFIQLSLSVLKPKYKGDDTYSDSRWYLLERAVRCLLKVEDIGFLPELEGILPPLEKEEMKPFEDVGEHDITRVQHIAFLKEAIEILTRARTAQTPDINLVFGNYLRGKAGLSGSVIARLSHKIFCDTVSTDEGEQTQKIEISLSFEPTKPEEGEKLLTVLQKYRLSFDGEGFVWPGGLTYEECDKWAEQFLSHHAYSNHILSLEKGFEGLGCCFSAYATKGINRFSVELRKGEKEETLPVYSYLYLK